MVEAVALATTRASVPDVVTFVISAAVILAGAIGVVLSRNPVHAALSLVMTLLGIAVLFVEEDADFIAAVQVIVYAGAIVVLFLFVIMFLGVDREENLSEPLPAQRPLAVIVVVVAIAGIMALAATAHWITGAHGVVGPIRTSQRSEVAQIGVALFTKYLYAFEATAGLLVIAVVGAVYLARRPPGGPDDGAEDDMVDADDVLPVLGDGTGQSGSDAELELSDVPDDEAVTSGSAVGSEARLPSSAAGSTEPEEVTT